MVDYGQSQQHTQQQARQQRKAGQLFKGIGFGKKNRTASRPDALTPDDWTNLQPDISGLPSTHPSVPFTAIPQEQSQVGLPHAQDINLSGADVPLALRIPMAAKWADEWTNPQYHPNSVVSGIALVGNWLADLMGIEDEDELALRDELAQPVALTEDEQALLDQIPDVSPETLFAVKRQRQQAAQLVMQQRFPSVNISQPFVPPGLKVVLDKR